VSFKAKNRPRGWRKRPTAAIIESEGPVARAAQRSDGAIELQTDKALFLIEGATGWVTTGWTTRSVREFAMKSLIRHVVGRVAAAEGVCPGPGWGSR
jgi:hypothetical protein